MNVSKTLSRYLGRTYLINLFLMVLGLWAFIYLFDTVELLRRASKQDDVPLSLVLQMGLLKLPEVGMLVFPFAILFSAIFTFWQLTQRHELVVMRSSGFSVWQFLTPVLSVAIITGFLSMMVMNPVSAMLVSKFETLETNLLSNNQSHVALFEEGLWLRQTDESRNYVILHADKIKMPEWELQNVMALYFDKDNNFKKRIDAKMATIQDGMWLFKESVVNAPQQKKEVAPLIALPTTLTATEIEDSFSSPETLSFWALPGFIETLQSTGFSATRLKIHFQSLLSQPLLYASMILLAAAVSLRPPRSQGTLLLAITGVIIGFITFFMSSFLQALGASHQIPVILAAWTPALTLALLGVAAIFSLEDG